MQIEQIFSVQTLFLALGIGVLVSVVKTIAEAKWVNLSANLNWGKIYVPTLAIVIGMLLALFVSVQPQFLANANTADKLLQGCISGFFSSYIFRIANALMKKEIGDDK